MTTSKNTPALPGGAALQARAQDTLDLVGLLFPASYVEKARAIVEGSDGQALAAWELFLAHRRTESSRETTTRMGRVVASELFGRETIDEEGHKVRQRIEPEDAPWLLLAMPGAAVLLSEYREHIGKCVEARHAGGDSAESGLSRASGQSRIAVVRGLVRALWQAKAFSLEERERLLESVTSLAASDGGTRAQKPAVELADLQLLIRDAQRQATAPRKGESANSGLCDLAALALLSLGLRSIECTRARWEDIAQLAGGAVLNVRGKGSKARVAGLNENQEAVLEEWRQASGGFTKGPVLRPVQRNGVINKDDDTGVTPRALSMRIAARATKVGVPLDGLHSFRRWRITTEIAAGESLTAVARRAGHSNPRTTAAYDTTGADADAAGGRAIGRGLFRSAG